MEFDSVIEKRHSSRNFKDKKVSWKSVLEAIHAAIKIPSPSNQSHIKFIIIENKDTIGKLAEYSNQLWINESNLIVVVVSDDTNLENQFGERGRVYSRQTAGASIENLILKLTDLGLNSCWVGAYSDELIKQNLKIPMHMQIEAIIPVGYEKEKHEKKHKTNLENVLRWEDFETASRESLYRESPLRKPNLY